MAKKVKRVKLRVKSGKRAVKYEVNMKRKRRLKILQEF